MKNRKQAVELYDEGTALLENSQIEAAFEKYDEVKRRFVDSPDAKTQVIAVMAMVNKAHILSAIEREPEAKTLYDEILRRFHDSTDPEMQKQVCKALKGILGHHLQYLKSDPAVIEKIAHRIVHSFRDHSDPEVALSAMVVWGSLLSLRYPDFDSSKEALQKDGGEVLKLLDEILSFFNEHQDPSIRRQWNWFLLQKIDILMKIQKYEQAIEACTKGLRRCKDDDDAVMEMQEIEILSQAGKIFWLAKQPERAKQTRDIIIKKYGIPEDSRVRQSVIETLLREAEELIHLGLLSEARKCYMDYLWTFSKNPRHKMRVGSCYALLQIAALATHLESPKHAVSTYERIIEQFSHEADEDFVELVEIAKNRLQEISAAPPNSEHRLIESANLFLPPPRSVAQSITDESTSQTFWVSSSFQLQKAIHTVAPGDDIRLEPGQYHISSSLVIEKTLRIVGSGAGKTQIVFTTPHCGVELKGDHEWHISNVHIVHLHKEVQKPADIILQSGGALKMEGVIIQGAFAGSAINVSGGKSLQVRNCQISNNFIGILATPDGTKITVEQCSFENNISSGIILMGSTTGVVRSSTFAENHYAGIAMLGEASATLQDNLCHSANFGIVFRHNSAGLATGNRCTRNVVGIGVTEDAHPNLAQNICHHNLHFGIAYDMNAAGEAFLNVCQENNVDIERDNIRVFPPARPTLSNNTTKGESEESDEYYSKKLYAKRIVQMEKHNDLQAKLDLGSHVPGLAPELSELIDLPLVIRDDELSLAILFEEIEPAYEDDALEALGRRILPRWTDILKRFVAEGRKYV